MSEPLLEVRGLTKFFPVKAGRAYELRTTDLAIGVDTVLSVSAGGVASAP